MLISKYGCIILWEYEVQGKNDKGLNSIFWKDWLVYEFWI